MPKVSEIAFFAYPVTDVVRARRFYEGPLALSASHVFEFEGKHWIEYDIGPGTLALTSFMPDWKASEQGGRLALELEDFDAVVEELKRFGARFIEEPSDSPVCRMALVADPDGNRLFLHKRKACHAHP